jgi:hypothetical protein
MHEKVKRAAKEFQNFSFLRFLQILDCPSKQCPTITRESVAIQLKNFEYYLPYLSMFTLVVRVSVFHELLLPFGIFSLKLTEKGMSEKFDRASHSKERAKYVWG